MGKSYKKTPISKDNGRSKKYGKKVANKQIRAKLKTTEIGDGGEYKKHSESYDIADYVYRWTKEEAIDMYNKRCTLEYWSHSHLSKSYCEKCVERFKKEYPTLESFLLYWEKCVRRK